MNDKKTDKFSLFLFILSAALLIIPWAGKKVFPFVFGWRLVQRPTIILLSIVLGLAFFRTISIYLKKEEYRASSFNICVLLTTISLFTLMSSFIVLPSIFNVYTHYLSHECDLAKIAHQHVERAYSDPLPENRYKAAQMSYYLSGIQTYYLNKDDEIILYEPNKK